MKNWQIAVVIGVGLIALINYYMQHKVSGWVVLCVCGWVAVSWACRVNRSKLTGKAKNRFYLPFD